MELFIAARWIGGFSTEMAPTEHTTDSYNITNCCFAVDGKRNGFSLLEVYFSAFPLDNVIICFKNIQVEGCIGTNLLLVEALI